MKFFKVHTCKQTNIATLTQHIFLCNFMIVSCMVYFLVYGHNVAIRN